MERPAPLETIAPVEESQNPLEGGKLGLDEEPGGPKGGTPEERSPRQKRSLGGAEPALDKTLDDSGRPEGGNSANKGGSVNPAAAMAKAKSNGVNGMTHRKKGGASENGEWLRHLACWGEKGLAEGQAWAPGWRPAASCVLYRGTLSDPAGKPRDGSGN